MFIEHTTQPQLFTGPVTATNLFATTFTSESAEIRVLDIIMYEVSGFRASGPVNIDDSTNSYSSLTITQPGSGFALLVNDEIPESTPFVITNTGDTGIGTLVPIPGQKLTVIGDSYTVGTGTYKSNDDFQYNLKLQRSANTGRVQIRLEDETSNQLWNLGTTNAGASSLIFVNTLGTDIFTLNQNGQLDVTSDSLASKIELIGDNGSIKLNNVSGQSYIKFQTTGGEADCQIEQFSNGLVISTGGDGAMASRLNIDEFGQVGINTGYDLLSEQLTVNGTISSSFYVVAPQIGIGVDIPTENLTVQGNISGSDAITITTLNADILGKSLNLNSQILTNANIDSGAIDGVTIGTNAVATEIVVDQIRLNNSTINTTGTNNLVFNTNSGTNSSSITIDATTKNIDFALNGAGEVNIPKVDIDSGTIDGTTINNSSIGATTPSTGKFTSVQTTDLSADNVGKNLNFNSHSLTNLNIDSGTIDDTTINNSTIGITTPLAAQFTTLTATGIIISSNIPNTVSQNTVFAGPVASAGAATFRSLAVSDIPTLDLATKTSGTLAVGRGGTGATSFTSGSVLIGNGTGALNTVAGLTTTLSALSSNSAPFGMVFNNGILTAIVF